MTHGVFYCYSFLIFYCIKFKKLHKTPLFFTYTVIIRQNVISLEDDMNINDLIIKEDNWNTIWKYIKGKKNQDIPKVFYLYYKLELNIKEISKELNTSESYIKHLIYRTLKELQDNFGNGGKYNDK